jgi:ParB family transcriptional regulator, chromosome partitioning protein
VTVPDIHVSRITPHSANIREELGDLTELAASIRIHGIVQPLAVQPHPARPGRYQLLAGHRRLAAAKLARLEMVPCVIRRTAAEPARAIELMLVENCQRRDLSPVEKAEAMGALRNHGMTAAQIAKRTGLSDSTVSNCLALLDLDEATRARIAAGTVTVGSAIKAVRETRKAARDGTTGRPAQALPPWFTSRHPLAAAAAALCGHTRRPQVGQIACGQCWEQAIRDDQDTTMPEPDLEPCSPRQERMEHLAGMPLCDSHVLQPGQVSAGEASERLGVSRRTVQRYKRDLAGVTT